MEETPATERRHQQWRSRSLGAEPTNIASLPATNSPSTISSFLLPITFTVFLHLSFSSTHTNKATRMMRRPAVVLCCAVVFLACLMHETEPSRDQDSRRFRLGLQSKAQAAAAASIGTSQHLGAQWTWISGNDTRNVLGSYGTSKGVASPSSYPGAREGHVGIYHPSSDSLFIFGGEGYDVQPDVGSRALLNDLWRYDIADGKWTWISGNDTANVPGSYGTKGVASFSNYPGARNGHVGIYHPSSDSLFIFGGEGYDVSGGGFAATGALNDLWQYNMKDGNWTWISGNDTRNALGSYGTKGVASSSSYPGAREGHAGIYHPSSDSLFIFGGWGYATSALLNDLWQYNITDGKWTWISGSDTTDVPGSYGTKGVASSFNYPGARSGHVGIYHPSSDSLFIFGGYGPAIIRAAFLFSHSDPISRSDFPPITEAATSALNDLWQHNITRGRWTWLSGNDISNVPGFNRTKGVASSSNYPGARDNQVGIYHPASNSLFIFGGEEYDTSGELNDHWQYNITDGTWSWISGNGTRNVPGSYGAKGIASSSNYPGARDNHVGIYHPASNSLLIFGGWGYANSAADAGYLNDLWMLQLPESCPAGASYPFCDVCPVGTFSPSNNSECRECPQGKTSVPGASICTAAGHNWGLIIGVPVGVVVLLGAIGYAYFASSRRRQRNQAQIQEQSVLPAFTALKNHNN